MTAAPRQESPPIRRLSEGLVAKIAAGEVVERPASVVKELVENSVDAGAANVVIRLASGGLELVEVTDDGWGIPANELRLAIERHATSKLGPELPLEAIETLGFRGEALAAIGSVSRLKLRSRTRGSNAANAITVVGGTVIGERVEGGPVGTTVEVRNLFFNTPARKKFLHSPAAEQVEVLATVERLYLARPEVGISVWVGESESARYPGSLELGDAAARVLGTEFVEQSFSVLAALEGTGSLRGVFGRPSISRGTSQSIFLSVNGRSVSSRVLTQAIRLAYADYLPKSRFPIGVAQLRIDLDRVDVNVHPTKKEVRLTHERELADSLRRLVLHGLTGTPHAADVLERASIQSKAPRPSVPTAPPPAVAGALGAPMAFLPLIGHSQLRLLPPDRGRKVAGSSRHPEMKILGCLFALYWIAEAADGLVLIDQHAASERLLFDALLKEGHLARQRLVSPITLELTARQAALLAEHETTIGAAGFDVEPYGGKSFRLRSVPVFRGRRSRPESLPVLLEELGQGGRPTVPNGLKERTAASVACHAAIRAGDVVTVEEIGRVLESLYGLPEPAYACPHGRPIIVRVPRSRLDRWFLRSAA